MADNKITSANKSTYFAQKVGSHGKNMFVATGFPSVEAYYGPYESKQLAHSCMVERYRNDATLIPQGLTVAVVENGEVVEYQYKKSTPVGGYSASDLEKKFAAATPDADEISYDPTETHPSNSVGAALKNLENFKEENSGSKVEPVATTTVDLSTKESSGASFTYDVDTKYTYSGHDTTFYQYKDSTDTKYYGVFKVYGLDKYLMYVITNMTTFTYEGTCTETLLPADAKKEFELGTLATVKRVNGDGETWKNGTVNIFCTKQNMILEHVCRSITFGGTTGYRVVVKSEDGNKFFVYKANLTTGNYEHEANVDKTVAADATNFRMLEKLFGFQEASDVPYNNTTSGLTATNAKAALDEVAAKINNVKFTLVTDAPTNNVIPDPDKNIYYDLSSSAISTLDVSSVLPVNTNEVVIKFLTDSTCTFTTANTQRILGSTTFAAGKVHIMSILRGVICVVEAPLVPST